ncbi:MAG: membrane-bound PQQ-dependent dehydrogenase, glucose/quinate/shikimate family, partial [Alphaproteobacteria bacterium]
MAHPPRSTLLTITAIVLALLGGALAAGGAWLIALGGSWYYLVAGAGFLVTAGLLLKARPAALWVYAAVVAGTLAWALWESGLDWWALAVRGDVVVPIGLFLLTPWITRAIDRALVPPGEPRPLRVTVLRGGGLALTATLAASLVVAVISWFSDPHRIDGTAPDARAEVPGDARGVPPGEWHAYGRTWDGQRWSPLDQITPENVDRLEVAWTYRTGDVRGQPGDPEETTFQVTPLMMDNRLFLCTPHQLVIALDATTGEEIWRYDPEILDDLALQHLTCRGLTHYAGPATAPAPETEAPAEESPEEATGEADAVAVPPAEPSPVPGLPVATADAEQTTECTARLFMPTADGRVIALDPESGAVCSNFGGGTGQIDLWPNMPNVQPGAYYSTSPVVVASDLVIVGGTVLDNVSTSEQSGVIRAFDATSGVLVWNWDSGDPDRTEPLPPGETYVPNSPNSWTIMSVDEELGLVYVPLGNQPPDQWGGNRSENVERFSSAVVALDVETGALAWTFQTVHHDLWDYDVPSQPTLVDLTIASESVPALVQPTKQGDIYVLDRRTGEPILPVEEV